MEPKNKMLIIDTDALLEQLNSEAAPADCDHPFRVTGDTCLNCGAPDTDVVAMAARIRQLEARLAEEKETFAKIAGATQRGRDAAVERAEIAEERLAESQARLAGADATDERLRGELQQMEWNYERLSRENKGLRMQLAELKEHAGTLGADLYHANAKRLAEAEAENVRWKQLMEAWSSRHARLLRVSAALKTQLAEARAELEVAGAAVWKYEAERNVAIAQLAEANAPREMGEVSDGYHTFNELYNHRILLFAALTQARPHASWKAKKHHDGTSFEGWFIAGMDLNGAPITYHLPEKYWDLCVGDERETAPEWDGHTSADVIERLKGWLTQ